MLQSATTEPDSKIWEKVEKSVASGDNVLSTLEEDQYGRVKHGGYAVISDITTAYKHMAQDCSLTLAEQRFRPMIYTMFLQKNSAYTDEVNDM